MSLSTHAVLLYPKTLQRAPICMPNDLVGLVLQSLGHVVAPCALRLARWRDGDGLAGCSVQRIAREARLVVELEYAVRQRRHAFAFIPISH